MEAATRIDSSGVNQAPAAPAAAPVAPASAPVMDRDFVIKNQIVERYLAGRLPPKGVTDFERLIRSRPELIEELGLPDRVNAGLRLLDAAGIAEPWAEKEKKFWEKPAFTFAAAGVAIAALIGCLVLGLQVSSRNASITKLQAENHERPVMPSTRKRSIIVTPSRNGPPAAASLTINTGEFAEMKTDLSWSRFTLFRVTIERINQGRVGIFDGLEKDSNGHVRISLNSGALGPGDYLVTLEGLDMRRQGLPVGWYRFSVAR